MAATLTTWHPFEMIDPFRKEMETLFDRFFGDEGGNGRAMPAVQTWAPRMDIEETEKEIVVKADLPGVDPKVVEISVENEVLTVRGEKKEEKNRNYHRVERLAGSFYRAIALPPGTEADKVSADSANGVITITIPKKPEAQPRKIMVTPVKA